MDHLTFELLALFGLPAVMTAVLLLAYRLIPRSVWLLKTVQAFVAIWFIAIIAVPVTIMLVDSQGEYFDGSEELVQTAFALPAGVEVDYQRDRTVKLGDCWQNAVNWRSEARFLAARDFEFWLEDRPFQTSIVAQIEDYFGLPVAVEDGALQLRGRDPKYRLSDELGSFQANKAILEFPEPFLCAAIERHPASSGLVLRPCDPIARPFDKGSEGWVIVNPDRDENLVEGRIQYRRGPKTCINPIRRRINEFLGLPHPPGEPDLGFSTTIISR